MRTIDNINDLNKSDFLSIFGNVFEKTESVASEAFESKPFKNLCNSFKMKHECFPKHGKARSLSERCQQIH